MPRKKVSKAIAKRQKLPQRLIKARQARILRMHASGKTPEEIAIDLDIGVNIVNRELGTALDSLVKHYAMPTPEQTFVRYAAFQFEVIRKLEESLEVFRDDSETKQYNAMISALKAQSDIYDKIMNKGTEFGVIQKKKAAENIRKKPQELRIELRKEATILLQLLDEIEDAGEIDTGSTKLSKRVTKIIRKVITVGNEVKRAGVDWKYRTKTFDEEGKKVSFTDMSEDDLQKLSPEARVRALEQKLKVLQEKEEEAPPIIETTAEVVEKPETKEEDGWLVAAKKG